MKVWMPSLPGEAQSGQGADGFDAGTVNAIAWEFVKNFCFSLQVADGRPGELIARAGKLI